MVLWISKNCCIFSEFVADTAENEPSFANFCKCSQYSRTLSSVYWKPPPNNLSLQRDEGLKAVQKTVRMLQNDLRISSFGRKQVSQIPMLRIFCGTRDDTRPSRNCCDFSKLPSILRSRKIADTADQKHIRVSLHLIHIDHGCFRLAYHLE